MSSEGIVKQNGFNFSWEPIGEKPTVMSDGFFSMRGWQEKAFDELKDAPFMILNAPMGSGKSWMMCLLSACKMKKNTSLRCIIAVPQTIIAPGFANANLQLPDGENLIWCPKHNLCNKESSKGTVNYIKNWLTGPVGSLDDRVLLCTHATLVKFYKRLRDENSLHLLENLLLWVDEAHHVKNIAMEDLQGPVISNGIGELVTFLLDTKMPIQMGLTTASFFRGDRCSLLTDTMEERFVRFNLPYDKYLQSMKHLESFSFDFLLCGHEYTKAIGNLAQQRKGKDIIYVPHPTSRHSTGDKYKEVKALFAEYQKVHGGEVVDIEDGRTILSKAESDFKILDLVDEDRRLEKKEFINSPILKEHRDALDVIIALGMFKEGANWIWADRSIIVGVRESLVDVVQMMGRLFRDAKDKRHVEVVQLLPFSLDQQNNNFRDNLNNYLKAIYASLILEDILNPVKINVPKEKLKDIEPKSEEKKKSIQLSELIPDESTRLSLINDVVRHLASISHTNKIEGKGISALYNEYQSVLPNILERYSIDSQGEEIGDQIWSMLLRRSLNMQGIDVKDIDISFVFDTHPLEGLLRYTSGACGINTFESLRKAIQSASSHLEETQIIDWAKQHIAAYGKKPGKHTGIVEFAEGEHKGVTWAAIDIALKKGMRGLPGKSCLVKLIKEKLGIRSYHNPPALPTQLIIDWITSFINKHDRKPNKLDGPIEFAEGEYLGETWSSIDMALWRGGRGQPGKSSLASLIQENFGIKNHLDLPVLSAKLILDWVKQYIDVHGKKPHRTSGVIEPVSEEHKGITWTIVNTALEVGTRGLPGGSSLAKLIDNKMGIANPMNLPPLSEKLIVNWVAQFIDIHKEKPLRSSGVIEFASGEHKGITWFAVDSALKRGKRGISEKSSLASLIEKNFSLKNHMNLSPLTEELIISWVVQYMDIHGKKPGQGSGEIEFVSEAYKGITWLAVNTALDKGGRGLSGGSSIAKLIEKHLRIKNRTKSLLKINTV